MCNIPHPQKMRSMASENNHARPVCRSTFLAEGNMDTTMGPCWGQIALFMHLLALKVVTEPGQTPVGLSSTYVGLIREKVTPLDTFPDPY